MNRGSVGWYRHSVNVTTTSLHNKDQYSKFRKGTPSTNYDFKEKLQSKTQKNNNCICFKEPLATIEKHCKKLPVIHRRKLLGPTLFSPGGGKMSLVGRPDLAGTCLTPPSHFGLLQGFAP